MSLRIGSVPYLNARPLVYGLENLTLCEPSRLADLMHDRQLDVGLIPIAEVLLHDQYDVVDGIAIASRGAVRSVFLVHRGSLAEVTRVAVSPASRTSVWLLQVILKNVYGLEPICYPRPAGAKLSDHQAMMLIGDEAIWYANRHQPSTVLDLGAAWSDWTGLPFVYAVWAVQRGLGDDGLVQRLRDAKRAGLAHLEQIVQDSDEASPAFRREYLTKNVCYDLDGGGKRGVRRFQDALCAMQLLSQSHDLRYLS